VTTSGAVAHWWFRPLSQVGGNQLQVDVDLDVSLSGSVSRHKREDAVKSALVRATTSSFGSVCLGE
jgi:hypothetical protein